MFLHPQEAYVVYPYRNPLTSDVLMHPQCPADIIFSFCDVILHTYIPVCYTDSYPINPQISVVTIYNNTGEVLAEY